MKFSDLEGLVDSEVDKKVQELEIALGDYEDALVTVTEHGMMIFIAAVMKKYNLMEVELSTDELEAADSDWLDRSESGGIRYVGPVAD